MAKIKVEVEGKIKRKATHIFEDLGLDMESAINMFLVQVVNNNGLPFEMSQQSKKKVKLLNKIKSMIEEKQECSCEECNCKENKKIIKF